MNIYSLYIVLSTIYNEYMNIYNFFHKKDIFDIFQKLQVRVSPSEMNLDSTIT